MSQDGGEEPTGQDRQRHEQGGGRVSHESTDDASASSRSIATDHEPSHIGPEIDPGGRNSTRTLHRRPRLVSYPSAREKSIPGAARRPSGIGMQLAYLPRGVGPKAIGLGSPGPSELEDFSGSSPASGRQHGVSRPVRRGWRQGQRSSGRESAVGRIATAAGRAAAPGSGAIPRPRGPRRPREKGGPAMKNPRTTETSQCVSCGGRLRNAVFCSACGHSSCSWACHSRHLAQHSARPGRPASLPGRHPA